jgi:FlaA1/EpsC-like NDP-sugar epimerase
VNRIGTAELARLVAGRPVSLLADDVARSEPALRARFDGGRVLVVGAAGSIGAATTAELLKLGPESVCLVDVNENGLAELLRDLRSSDAVPTGTVLRAVPLDVGSPTMQRVLTSYGPFDAVLNFAAVKHVRSERDIASLLHMLDVNVVKADHLLRLLDTWSPDASYFAVSTDKAANPVNLMGCSKRVMEIMMFRADIARPVSSARFANVAFSDGSLLHGWLRRLDKEQPWAVPGGTRRYFVTPAESGQLCLLGAGAVPDRHVVYPALDAGALQDLQAVAERVMRALDLQPLLVRSEEEARAAMAAAVRGGPYPLLVTNLDTMGEKEFEEFLAEGDLDVNLGLGSTRALRPPAGEPDAVAELLDWLRFVLEHPAEAVTKEDVLSRLMSVVPELKHRDSGRSLDDRM